jgi:excisionase family DNA binding protein
MDTNTRRLPDADLLTPVEVARLLKVTRRTLQRMVARGEFPTPHRLTLKTIRWPRAAVEAAAGLAEGVNR